MIEWLKKLQLFGTPEKVNKIERIENNPEWKQMPSAPILAKDWVEDFSLPEGKFAHLCLFCKEGFVGHKRRVACKQCCSGISGI